MPTVDIKDWNNKKVGSVDLPDEIFAYPYKEHLIHEAVKNYLALASGFSEVTRQRAVAAAKALAGSAPSAGLGVSMALLARRSACRARSTSMSCPGSAISANTRT